MKKLLPLLYISFFLLAACGGGDGAESANTQKASSAEKTSTPESAFETATRLEVNEEALKGLEISAWTPWYGVEQSLFDSFVRQFNSENPWGIRVTAESFVNFSGLYEAASAALPRTDRPNLVVALPEHAQEWHSYGAVVDLTDYANDPLYGMGASDIPDVFWIQDTAGDARIGIPAQRTAQVLLWNETWANELGFDSPPQGIEDFRAQACGAHASMLKDGSPQNDALGGWLVDTQPMTAYSWMLAFEGGVMEEGNYRFLAPNNVNAFRFLRKLSEDNCAWQGSEPIAAFTNREALFVTVSLGDLPHAARAFASAASADKWSVIPFPGEDGGVIAIYGSSYVVLDSTKEQQLAAWLFARWLVDVEQDARWVEASHLFPLRSSTLNLLGDYERTHPQWRQAVDLIPQGRLQPQLGSWRTIKTMLGDGFAHMYRINVPSGQVAAILAQMDSTARDLSE
jgi:sn-glycerol 3-phosphate transport system substrate-binding protein